MVAVAEAPKDWRVEAIKAWAVQYNLTEMVETHSEADLLKYVYGVRSEAGAIKKFCAAAGISNPADIRVAVPREERPSKVALHDIQDGAEFAVEAELRGVKIKTCPKCHTMVTPKGECFCF